jgi:hypothetical protein
MDSKKHPLGKVRGWQVKFLTSTDAEVDVYERAVGLAISTGMNEKHEWWAMTTGEIARRANVYDDTASDRIRRLIERGWIVRKRRKHASPLYGLAIPANQDSGSEWVSYDQDSGSQPVSYDQDSGSQPFKTPAPSGQDSGSRPGQSITGESVPEESIKDLSTGEPEVPPEVFATEFVDAAFRGQIVGMDDDILDVLAAAAEHVITGKMNGLSDWRGHGTNYAAVHGYMKSLGSSGARDIYAIVAEYGGNSS